MTKGSTHQRQLDLQFTEWMEVLHPSDSLGLRTVVPVEMPRRIESRMRIRCEQPYALEGVLAELLSLLKARREKAEKDHFDGV